MVHRHRALQQAWLTCSGAYADAVPGGVSWNHRMLYTSLCWQLNGGNHDELKLVCVLLRCAQVGVWPAGHRFSSSATASTLDRTAESGTQPSGAVWRARPTRPDQKWLYIQPKAGRETLAPTLHCCWKRNLVLHTHACFLIVCIHMRSSCACIVAQSPPSHSLCMNPIFPGCPACSALANPHVPWRVSIDSRRTVCKHAHCISAMPTKPKGGVSP